MGLGVDLREVAKENNCSRWTMRRKLLALQELFPDLTLLVASKGKKRPVGKYSVNVRALNECKSIVSSKNTQADLLDRLDMHEGIFRGLKTRIKRLERRVSMLDGGRNKLGKVGPK
jgi:hypothetical protein